MKSQEFLLCYLTFNWYRQFVYIDKICLQCNSKIVTYLLEDYNPIFTNYKGIISNLKRLYLNNPHIMYTLNIWIQNYWWGIILYMPHQAQWRCNNSKLVTKCRKTDVDKGMVKMSATWSFVEINRISIDLDATIFRTKWKSISTCLV